MDLGQIQDHPGRAGRVGDQGLDVVAQPVGAAMVDLAVQVDDYGVAALFGPDT
ncbi:hypothetical protein [Actinomadura sp. KC216]|uniref:hypothetical protein n=1 Tax=Actinomadura sp. KC216 TaxID=2530370 RepID=UPI001FB6E91B|nr:hypothetical protein [Actinomadura sp. KC216]